ncbi:hypothetical protein LUZ60_002589 [Juncus effusus]|nr:hypothetical protein LUZ60_002589 [Juncus effusus]
MAVVEDMREMVFAVLPYTIMILKPASSVVLMTLVRSTVDRVYGVKPVVLTAYQQLAATIVLCFLALVFDQGRSKRPSFQVLSWAFLIGLLHIAIGDILLTASLQYITTTVQSVGLNMFPIAVFILAILTRRENFHFCDLYGQAKLSGVLVSTIGAMIVVMASDTDTEYVNGALHGFWIGVLMVISAVLALAVDCLLVEKVANEFSSDIALAAIINVFGTIQTFMIAFFIERDLSSWKINSKSPELLSVLYGGIIATGIFYLAQNWCTHKKGSVFTSSFSPLLVVYSFLSDTFILRSETRLGSVIGAILVIGGLYLLLWAKTRDKKEKIFQIDPNYMLESS